ncbi:unnamed protein product [Symbiodinium natans]|uniref:Uncharacterized protein n=1 Tax=Symbiodinium natans TaxID=878477 RepID=A0A812TU88_9DINO|nr:unnamed protein product [Symbiodinium natans]
MISPADVTYVTAFARQQDDVYGQAVFKEFLPGNVERILLNARDKSIPDGSASDFIAALSYQSILAARFKLFFISFLAASFQGDAATCFLLANKLNEQMHSYLVKLRLQDLVNKRDVDLQKCDEWRQHLLGSVQGQASDSPLVFPEKAAEAVYKLSTEDCGQFGDSLLEDLGVSKIVHTERVLQLLWFWSEAEIQTMHQKFKFSPHDLRNMRLAKSKAHIALRAQTIHRDLAKLPRVDGIQHFEAFSNADLICSKYLRNLAVMWMPGDHVSNQQWCLDPAVSCQGERLSFRE